MSESLPTKTRTPEPGRLSLLFGQACLAIAVLVAWALLVSIRDIPAYLIPSPSDVWHAGFNQWASLMDDFSVTAMEAFTGLLLGAGMGFLCGVLFAHVKVLEDLFQPYLVALQAVPVVAIAPLLVLWFGSGMMGKILLSGFMSYFPVVVATTYGIRRIRNEQLELMQILSATTFEIFIKLRLPNSLSHIFPALRVSATLSVIGAIVAEIAGASGGLGHRILVDSYRTETASMFAAIFLAALLGLIFYGIVRVSGNYFLRNHDREFATL